MPYYNAPNGGYPAYIPQQQQYMGYQPTGYQAQSTNYQPMPQPTTNMVSPNAGTGFICRPVTSREEAVAVQTDFMASGTIMPDLGHGMVYFKRFNSNTGLSDWFEFALVQPQTQEESPAADALPIPDYSETFRAFGEQLLSVSERIDTLTDKLEQWRPKTSKKGNEEP